MFPAKLIMSPIDFSEHCDDAVKAAVDLASCFRSELCLVHVVPAIPKLPSASAFFHEGEYEQELHTPDSTKVDYFEGAAVVEDEAGRGLGEGYLEMTGYTGSMGSGF